MGSKRTGELLVQAGLIQASQLADARKAQARDGGSLGRALRQVGASNENAVAQALAKTLKLECLIEVPPSVPSEVRSLLPVDFCRQRLAVPVALEGNTLRLAMADPLDYMTLQDVEFRAGKPARVVVTTEPVILALVGQPSGAGAEPAKPREPQSYELLAGIQPAGEIESASVNEFDMVSPESLLHAPDSSVVEKLASSWSAKSGRWVKGAGCPQCSQSGYKGRLAIHELMLMTDELRELIAGRAKPVEPKRLAARVKALLSRRRPFAQAGALTAN